MTPGLSLHRLARRPSALLGLLLLALLARGLVAPGFMPVFGQGGAVAIVLCTPSGPATHWTADATGDHAAAGAACAFGAALGMAALLPELSTRIAAVAGGDAPEAVAASLHPSPEAAPYQARGPPPIS